MHSVALRALSVLRGLYKACKWPIVCDMCIFVGYTFNQL